MCTRLKLGFHPFQISKGVLGIAFDGTLFKLYIAVFKASLQKFKGRLKLLIILLTMSTSVLFLFFATPFYCGVPDIVYCAIKPSSFINFQMDLAFVLFLCTFHNILRPPPLSDLTILIFSLFISLPMLYNS